MELKKEGNIQQSEENLILPKFTLSLYEKNKIENLNTTIYNGNYKGIEGTKRNTKTKSICSFLKY